MPQGFPIRRALYAVTLDPYTLQELRRGFLPAGTLVEQPRTTLREAEARGLDSVAIRTRSNSDAVTIGVARVATVSLREAVR